MSLDRIDFIPSTLKFENTVEIDQPTNTGQFEKWFEQQLGEVNNQITDSGMELRKLAVGETDNLHHVMMSLEKSPKTDAKRAISMAFRACPFLVSAGPSKVVATAAPVPGIETKMAGMLPP